jgi:aryl-alcohol dehydrogenase-like predicted oxidoreductase
VRQEVVKELGRVAINQLTEIAKEKGIEVTQLALAWLLAQGDDVVPIPGTRNPERLTENTAPQT